MRRCLLFLLLSCLVSTKLYASDLAFDLSGPKVDVHVKRGEVTLPIGEVPNLLPGDRLWIHPDLPESQSAHFVLVVAFLRGPTNPPPPEWFTRVETWTPEVRSEGVFVTVPAEAQQALIFLAPETGGDFNTLRGAVRGRPGSFVRAAQDLQAASWDRMRVEAYLAEVKVTSQTDLKSLKEHAEMSARSLGIKLNQQCFDKPIDQQAPCLAANPEGLVMDDANAQSLVAQLANGSTLDLMNAISSSSMAGGGAYSPYVGAVVDTAKIFSSMHTAHFQYIPALALPMADTLNLRLNTPPSFRNPKSVVVVALPPLGPARPEPLHPVNPADRFCAQKPGLVLPAEGAPLAFASQIAHDLVLHIEPQAGSGDSPVDLPLKADPAKGGLVQVHPVSTLPNGDLTGVLRGKWGFDDWEGPRYSLHAPQSGKWSLEDGDQSALVVGREDTLHFEGDSTLCVDRVEKLAASGNSLRLTWKSPRPELLEVSVPMRNASPGPVTLQISQFGLKQPDKLVLKAYAEAASLDRMTLNAGDTVALLKGTRLDEVAKAELEGIALTPAHLSRVQGSDQLALNASASTASLDPTKPYFANVQLRDGRKLKVPVTVDPPRPQVSLLSKGTQDGSAATPSPVTLGSPDDLPVNGRLVFFLKSSVPANFPRDEKVEVAAADGSFRTVLSLADGSLMLEDAKTAMGSVEPLARFGSSAFGPVRVRALSADGTAGDWLPLGTLVRVPAFRDLRCLHAVAKPCTLTGMNLFLAVSIAATSDFGNAADVPPDFTGTQLSVPHPVNGVLYLKLRDAPETVQTLTLPVTPMAQPESKPIAPQVQQLVAPPEASGTQPAAPVSAPAAAPGTQPATASPAATATKPGA
ncbi:MAG: hypothetical protein P4K94_11510 [Terracidiphilus sp.]|nr:hypothetical protein [Terracidiphilus sp.]